MTHTVTLKITSLLAVLLMSSHFADDIVRGMEAGGFSNVIGVLLLVVWLCGTLMLAEQRSGYVVILIFSIPGSCVPYHPHEG